MADYWKSQDRKFCEFCKCWIADNKPSIGFHEGGKRHKENVAKKLKEMMKKSNKDMKEKAKLDDEMKKMEQAALKAYMKDMQQHPDYTSGQIKEKMKEKGLELPKMEKVEERPAVPVILWYEAKTEEGLTYYWNIHTNESLWEPPPDGYISLAKQQKEHELKQRLEEVKNAEKKEELRSWQNREAMKRFRVDKVKVVKKEDNNQESSEKPVVKPTTDTGLPSLATSTTSAANNLIRRTKTTTNPYGSWTKVVNTQPTDIDLQLPESGTSKPEIYLPVVSEPKIKIKEKKCVSLREDENEETVVKSEPTVFKKRKPNPSRANIRARIDLD